MEGELSVLSGLMFVVAIGCFIFGQALAGVVALTVSFIDYEIDQKFYKHFNQRKDK